VLHGRTRSMDERNVMRAWMNSSVFRREFRVPAAEG
jgi:hypothetical protein